MIVVPITIRRLAPGSDCHARLRITEDVLWVALLSQILQIKLIFSAVPQQYTSRATIIVTPNTSQ
jgi:hypothetical protein